MAFINNNLKSRLNIKTNQKKKSWIEMKNKNYFILRKTKKPITVFDQKVTDFLFLVNSHKH